MAPTVHGLPCIYHRVIEGAKFQEQVIEKESSEHCVYTSVRIIIQFS